MLSFLIQIFRHWEMSRRRFPAGMLYCTETRPRWRVWSEWFYECSARPQVVFRFTKPVGGFKKPRCFHFGILIVKTINFPSHLTCHFYHLITKERGFQSTWRLSDYILTQDETTPTLLRECCSFVAWAEQPEETYWWFCIFSPSVVGLFLAYSQVVDWFPSFKADFGFSYFWHENQRRMKPLKTRSIRGSILLSCYIS